MMNARQYTTDTSADADKVQLELVRAMTPAERSQRALRLTSQMLGRAKAAIRRQHPDYTDEQVGIRLIELHYGEQLARDVRSHLESRNRG